MSASNSALCPIDLAQRHYRIHGLQWDRYFTRRNVPMELLKQLFTTDVGLFTAVGLGFLLCMAGFFLWLFTRDDAPKNTPHA